MTNLVKDSWAGGRAQVIERLCLNPSTDRERERYALSKRLEVDILRY
jgi:hypothetical protein